MSYNQEGTISILSGKPLKLVDQFIYLSSSISSSENDVNIYLAKVWNTIDWLLIIWKSDLSDKIKWNFFQAVSVWMHHIDADKTLREKTKWELHKNTACY